MKIDLLKPDTIETSQKPYSKKKWKGFFIGILTLLIISAFFFSSKIISSEEGKFTNWGRLPFSKSKKHLPESKDRIILGEEKDRINILLLGIGGIGHEGANLTYTIILVSIKPSIKKVALLSIPRDLIVPIPGYGWRKINNANAFGENASPGNGGMLVSQVVSQVFDVPIHYYIRIDFAGFKKLVDDLGGVKIYIEKSFKDFQYPTENHKYQTVSFEKGWKIMDGEETLKFVRSRHGTYGEGSDFSRSKRQQKVLKAISQKILSWDTLISPKKILAILNTFEDHIKANCEIWEAMKLVKLAREISSDNIIHKVLDTSPENPLYSAIIQDIYGQDAYVLYTKTGNFSELQYIAQNIFSLPEVQKEEAQIEIQNGTNWPGLATREAETLKKLGYEITKIGNAKEKNYEKTVIYDLSQGQKSDTLQFLKEKFDANVVVGIPTWLTTSFTSLGESFIDLDISAHSQKNHVDFIIILGKNSITK